ncbi:MAG TPA: dienelactone hydrolase family protein [Chloroflexota bacterium]|nr:dienelactone hydrolase family protein [Chloroflexota bacterium]
MNQFQRYLLDEFVEDYRDGRMSRRDFVMKVIGVSGGLAAATGLFSSVGLSAAEIAAAQAAPRVAQTGPDPVTISPSDPAISVMDVQFPSNDGSTLLGYLAMPAAPGTYAGIVVIHENRGLLEHHKDVARRYAKAGFAALAPDLVSREGGTDNADPDQVPGFLAGADPQRHVDDASGAGVYLQAQDGVRSDVHGITGFCFGGGVVWRTISQDLTVAAAVPFYGPPPPLDALAHTRAAALAFYGELDTGITGSAEAVQAALETAGVPHAFKVYPGANHAFFNDTGDRYNKAAATDAWTRAVAWFQKYLT